MITIEKFESTLRIAAQLAWDASQGPAWRKVKAHSRREFSAFSVALGGGRNPYWYTEQSQTAKTRHNADVTDLWEQVTHYGAPERTSGVINMCTASTPGCRRSCLATSGQLGFPVQQLALVIRTRFMVASPFEAMVVMLAELEGHEARITAKGKRMVVRSNGTTDAAWERILPPPFFRRFFCQDYTKHADRAASTNYYIVQSATERHDVLPAGNVVVPVHVRRGAPLPATFEGRPVIDGDLHDLRFLDPQGEYAVLVRAKGRGRKDRTGFVRSVSTLVDSRAVMS